MYAFIFEAYVYAVTIIYFIWYNARKKNLKQYILRLNSYYYKVYDKRSLSMNLVLYRRIKNLVIIFIILSTQRYTLMKICTHFKLSFHFDCTTSRSILNIPHKERNNFSKLFKSFYEFVQIKIVCIFCKSYI